MAKGAVSVRIDEDKINELDQLAELNKRDRSFLINEAIDLYLDVNKWHIERIKAGLKQAKAGEFSSQTQVDKAMAKWRS